MNAPSATDAAAAEFDPDVHRSSCHFDRAYQTEDGYRCFRCGDPCELVTERPPEPKKPERKKSTRTFAEKPCCGSKGPRHKAGCNGSLPPGDDEEI